MKVLIKLCILLLIWTSSNGYGQDPIFSEYAFKEFKTQGRNAKIVFPKKTNDENLWIWRARFWGHEPQADIALLERGYHLVYIDVAGLFGSNKAVKIWNGFYHYVVNKYNLNRKVVLEGMSRGGLIVYNWAAQNTNKVFCIYVDAPVCDIKSWPGGLYKAERSEQDWQECLNLYGLDEKSVLDFKGNPVETAVKVAEAKIPVLHVCGASDKLVPYAENTAKLEENFKAAGGDIKIILKEGVGHHPHSLVNPKPIVDFIVEHTMNQNN